MKTTDELMNELIKLSFENGTFSGTPKKKRDSNFKKIEKIEKELLRREKSRENISGFKLSQETINEIIDDMF